MITFNLHKFFKCVIFEGTSFRPKNFACYTDLAMIHVFPEDSGGNTKWLKTSAVGAQWLSGRMLDSRQRGCGFEPHRCHCVVVLEQDTFILA